MSDAEHFCNNCFDFFYRSHKKGHLEEFEPWKTLWSASCRREGPLKLFMQEETVPFWAQCNECEKWRQLGYGEEINKEFNENFVCSIIDEMECSDEENIYVKDYKQYEWLKTLVHPPFLKNSPASPFLKDFYYDGIGLSPPKEQEEPEEKFMENLIPFYSPEDSEKARCICADVMTGEEREEFKHHIKDASIFLGLRNLIIAMWNINPKQYLTYQVCRNRLICRGIGRVTLAEELKKVLDFLTINGYVNFGILNRVPTHFNLNYWTGSVIVVGAGIAGIGAARQLTNAGCKVTVLEASDRCGGRLKDDHSLGNCIGLGAQILTGCINNPLYVMCEQVSLPLRYLGMRCDLIDDKGALIDTPIDQEIEFRFNLMLDSLEDWKQTISNRERDSYSLSEALAEQLKELQKSLCKDMTQMEKNLLEFHLGNLEYGCGSSLQNVSALHWNQNENYPQYSGAHAWAIDGFERIVTSLADGLDVRLNSPVASITYTNKNTCEVKTKSGKTLKADKIVCALPLSTYQSKFVEFDPELPKDKLKAIGRLGAGLIEKIALKFPTAFWRNKIGDADYFGHVPGTSEDRGMFSVFYDVSREDDFILMTVLAGEAVKRRNEMTDQELVDKCMSTLRKIFTGETVPDPTAQIISHWGDDTYTRMAYSYVKVGSSGQDLDILANTVNDKLYFAGEATNRQFPQTVTGAYLSGLREAKKILRSNSS